MSDVLGSYGDDGRTGAFTVRGVTRRPQVAWRARTANPVFAPPVLAGDTLVVLSGHTVQALDAGTGAVAWQHSPLGDDAGDPARWPAFFTTPAVWRDWLFVEDSHQEQLHVYELRTGQPVRVLPGGCPTVAPGDLLLLDHLDIGARALRLPDLQPLWIRDNRGSLAVSPALAGEIAYAAHGVESHHRYGGVTAFAVGSGEEIFTVEDSCQPCPLQRKCEGDEDWVPLVPAHPVVADGMVWTVADRHHDGWAGCDVLGLDLDTGRRRRLFHLGLDPGTSTRATGAVAVSDAVLYIATVDEGGPSNTPPTTAVRALDIRAGRPEWTASLTGTAVGSPVLAGDLLYLATTTGTVYALHRASGAKRWSIDIGEPIPLGTAARDGDGYLEDGPAVLPAAGMIFVRTGTGAVAIRQIG